MAVRIFSTVMRIQCQYLLYQLLADGDEFGFHALLSVGGSPRVVRPAVTGEIVAVTGVRDDGCVVHLQRLWLFLI